MADLRSIIAETEYEVIKIKCKPIPFPVRFVLPDEVKESMALTQVKAIDGIRTLRFYSPPDIGHTIEFRGHLWLVKSIYHECQIKGSSKADRLPTILTEYLGAVE
jgi:hypothetical protein